MMSLMNTSSCWDCCCCLTRLLTCCSLGRSKEEKLPKATAESRVEEMIKERVDAAVCATHPLGDGDVSQPERRIRINRQLPLSEHFAQLNARERGVERKPRQRECPHHDGHHPQCAQFTLLQQTSLSLHFIRWMWTEDLSSPNLMTDQDVTDGDDQKRNDVAQRQMGEGKVGETHPRLGPLFGALLIYWMTRNDNK